MCEDIKKSISFFTFLQALPIPWLFECVDLQQSSPSNAKLKIKIFAEKPYFLRVKSLGEISLFCLYFISFCKICIFFVGGARQ